MFENSKLIDAFTKARQSGLSDEQIKKDSLAAGWSIAEIDAVFELLLKKQIKPDENLMNVNMIPPVQNVPPITINNSVGQAPAPLPNQNNQTYITQTKSPKSKKGLIFTCIFVLLVSAFGAYAYYADIDINIFAGAPYKEDNLMSGILSRISQIESASYKLTFDIFATDRVEGAQPFNLKKDTTELKAQYERDAERFESIRDIISSLRYGDIPLSLVELKKERLSMNIEDPSGKPFLYEVTNGGKDFILSVTFETDDAITEIKESEEYSEQIDSMYKPIKIKEQTAMFTKDSYAYFYFSPEPPKSFFENMADFSKYAPPELKVNGILDLVIGKNENQTNTDWKINISSDADLGDITYKVNVDVLKKVTDYYLRINNLPSLFLSFLPPKGQWVKINSDDSATSTDSDFSILPSTSELDEYEETYKKSRTEMVEFIKQVAQIADEEKIFIFKTKPVKEKINEETAYRYELLARKESVLNFYTRVSEEAKKYDSLKDSEFISASNEYIEFLKSEQYSEMFDYYNQNINMTLWVDKKGFPISFKNSIRIVPPDEVVTLKDKQIMFDIIFNINNINTPITIEAPTDAKKYSEVMKEMQKQFDLME